MLKENQKLFESKIKEVVSLIEGATVEFQNDIFSDSCMDNCMCKITIEDVPIHIYSYSYDFPKIEASLDSRDYKEGDRTQRLLVRDCLKYNEYPLQVGFNINKAASRIKTDLLKRGLPTWKEENARVLEALRLNKEYNNKRDVIANKLIEAFKGVNYEYCTSRQSIWFEKLGRFDIGSDSVRIPSESISVDKAIQVIKIINNLD